MQQEKNKTEADDFCPVTDDSPGDKGDRDKIKVTKTPEPSCEEGMSGGWERWIVHCTWNYVCFLRIVHGIIHHKSTGMDANYVVKHANNYIRKTILIKQ